MKKLPLLLLTSLLAACSASDNVFTDAFRTVDLESPDANSLSQKLKNNQFTVTPLINLPFQMASLDSTNRIDITEKSPVVSFPEGNSFVAALQLPERINEFNFKIDSLIGNTVFVPTVLFLDENMQEISRIDNVVYIERDGFVIEKQFSKEIAPAIRYVIVYSQSDTFGEKTELFDIMRDYEKRKNGKDLPETSYPIPRTLHSPIGHININFSNVFLSALPVVTTKNPVTSEVMPATTATTATILDDTESFYLEQISKAITAGDMSRAKSLTEEAVRAGSTKALPHYMDEIGKLK